MLHDRSLPKSVTPPAQLSAAQGTALYVLAIALVPPLVLYATGGLQAIFRLFAADAFVYLSVAANSTAGFFTFDGSHATNGFHPIWQMLLYSVFEGFGITSDKEAQLVLAFWLSLALVAAGSVLTAQAVLRWTGSSAAAMLAIPGVFGALMLVCGWPVGTLWSFMNGMETPASLLFFGLLLYFLARRVDGLRAVPPADRTSLILMALICCGLVLSRLDDIFLPAVIGVWLLCRRDIPARNRLANGFWFALPLGAALAAYLAYNLATVGHAMPISGASKFDLRTPLINIGFLGSSLHALVPDFLYDPFSGVETDLDIASVNWRNAQMLLPIFAARLLLGRLDRLGGDAGSGFRLWMRLLLIYVIVKGLYNFLFVPLIHQGPWYYALSITIINVAAAAAIVTWWRDRADRRPVFRRAGVPLLALIALGSATGFMAQQRGDSPADRYHALFQRGDAVAEKLRETVAAPRIVEADDGIVNYALGLPTMSGFLFAIDPEAFEAYKRGDFLTDASRRGYQLIGSLFYLRNAGPEDLMPDTIAETLRIRTFNGASWDLDRFDFRLEYRDAETGAVFIRFTPKTTP